MYRQHAEPHFSERNNWLRAGVLGANDGLISTASLLMGMAATGASRELLLISGVSALVAGAVSMSAGEYVSVSSQADTERADLATEQRELYQYPEREHAELAQIYRQRGLSDSLADEVATALMAHDALDAHARDEIGITPTAQARPLQAALASALAFALGAILPVILVGVVALSAVPSVLPIATLLGLALLGVGSAKLGGAPAVRAVVRVVLWGVLAMGATALIGHLMGTQIA